MVKEEKPMGNQLRYQNNSFEQSLSTVLARLGNPKGPDRAVSMFTAGIRGENGQAIGGYPPAAIGLHPWLLDPSLAPPEWRPKYRAIHRELAADIEAVKAQGVEVQGVEVIPVSGMLSWEIRLYPDAARPQAGDSFYNTPAQIEGQGAGPVV